MGNVELVDTMTRGAAFLDALAGRPVTVVGFAAEAAVAVRQLHAAGAHVRRIEPTTLDADLTGEALVVVTSAAMLRAYAVAAARAAGVPVLSELDLAWCTTEAEAFAVAGGRGTATWKRVLTELLAAHGRVATPLADVDAEDADVVLVEPTVDQLASIQLFRPRVAVLLPGAEPLAPRLMVQQTADDCVLLSADDPSSRAVARAARARVVWLSAARAVDGVYVTRGRIAARLHGRVEEIYGAHGIAAADLEPVLAAIACALWMRVSSDTIAVALTRCLAPAAVPLPALPTARFAGASIRSLLPERARGWLGLQDAGASRATAPVTTGTP